MRQISVVILLAVAPVWADGPQPSVAMALIALKLDVEKQAEAVRAEMNKIGTETGKRKAWQDFCANNEPICQKALKLVEDNPSDRAAFDTLSWIVLGPFAYTNDCGPLIDRAFDLLIERHAADPRNAAICNRIDQFGLISIKPLFLRSNIERNDSRIVRGLACLKLGDMSVEHARIARLMRRNRSAELASEQSPTAELRAHLQSSAPEELEKQAAGAYKRASNEFANVQLQRDRTVGELARGRLFALESLVVGKPLPTLEGHGLAGKRPSAADYRGKVVMVVFWAGWWPPSTAIAGQLREFVQRYEGKSFGVLGVSGDKSFSEALEVAEREKVSWPIIYDGSNGRGPIAVAWGIRIWPTIIVVDAEGVIRHVARDLAGAESVIDRLLK